MIIGLIGLGYGFLSAPSSISEAKEMVSDSHHSDDHSSSTTKQIHDNSKHASSSNHNEKSSHDSGDHKNKSHNNSHAEDHTIDHDEHLLHQLQNRPWAALYVAALFFFMIPLGVLAFYAINRAVSYTHLTLPTRLSV